MLGDLVAVEREVVFVFPDVGDGDEEVFRGAVALPLEVAGFPLLHQIREVVLVGLGGALVVEREAVCLDVVEPDIAGAAALGEDEDGGGDAGVGFEDSGGQGDDGFELVVIDDDLPHAKVSLAGAEEHAVRHDDGGASAHLEHVEDEDEEEQLGLLGLDLALERGIDVFEVDGALEGRVGEHDIETVGALLGELFRKVRAEGVLIVDAGGLDVVQEQVHGRGAEHGDVEVEAVEHAALDVIQVGLQQVAGVVLVSLRVRLHECGGGVFLVEVEHHGDEEAAGAASGIADGVGRLGVEHFHHGADDVTRGAELPGDAGGGEFAEKVFVDVALGIAFGEREFLDGGDGAGEQIAGGDEAVGVLEVAAERVLLEIGPHEREEFVADDGEHAVAALIAEVGPAEVLLVGREGTLEVLLQAGGAFFLPRLGDVQQAGEHQVGDLLDDGDGIGDATGVEVQPEGVDFIAVCGGEGHGKRVGSAE